MAEAEKVAQIPSPVVRTSHGLVAALFDSIDKLNTKEIDSEHARALAHTAKTIVNIARLEFEVRKFSNNKDVKLTSLKLDGKPA